MKTRAAHLLSLLVCAACTAHVLGNHRYLDKVWEAFKEKHNKLYTAVEEKARRHIWEQNVKKIQMHNLEYDVGMHSYTLGLNEYADLTFFEYRRYLLGVHINITEAFQERRKTFPTYEGLQIPKSVDWRQHGYVTPIKNQGQCGSCWAFSTTGSLEGQHYKNTGQLVSLSEQNLVDCARDYGCGGCGGGWQIHAFDYIIKNKGIDTEESYPYEAKNDNCRFDRSYVGSNCREYVILPMANETALLYATAKEGPIAVAIDAMHQTFQLYKSGVYDEPSCSDHLTDHAVLVVGYGSEDDKDYWLVKNSWGTTWGMDGYIKMSRNKNNQCAIASYATYPIV